MVTPRRLYGDIRELCEAAFRRVFLLGCRSLKSLMVAGLSTVKGTAGVEKDLKSGSLVKVHHIYSSWDCLSRVCRTESLSSASNFITELLCCRARMLDREVNNRRISGQSYLPPQTIPIATKQKFAHGATDHHLNFFLEEAQLSRQSPTTCSPLNEIVPFSVSTPPK